VARHASGAVVAEIGLLRAAARVRIVDAHRGAFTLVDFTPAVVTDEHRLASHEIALLFVGKAMSAVEFLAAILRSFAKRAYSTMNAAD
jgi:hypothetical protein